jgi:predicted ATP-grasp superfamily ATP-dependent carboligase
MASANVLSQVNANTYVVLQIKKMVQLKIYYHSGAVLFGNHLTLYSQQLYQEGTTTVILWMRRFKFREIVILV